MKRIVFLLYGGTLLAFLLFSYLFIDPNLHYLKNFYTGLAFQNRIITTTVYILFILAFFGYYATFLFLSIRKKLGMREVKLLIATTCAILVVSYPSVLSHDIFNYLLTAKVVFFYHENPYIIMPNEFLNEPMLAFTPATNKIALYGPSWLLLTGIPYIVSFGNFVIMLFAFKIFVLLFYIGTVILIWKLKKSLSSLLFFALNPLVVIETFVSGHNDIVMVFFAFLAIYLFFKNKLWLALIFLIVSILVKYATLFLLPVFIYMLFLKFKKQPIQLDKVFYYSSILMIVAFFLSPLREELYPWYAIWFLPFVSLVPQRKLLLSISSALSFGLLFRYIGYMVLATHFGVTPILRFFVTITPVIAILFYYLLVKMKIIKKFRFLLF